MQDHTLLHVRDNLYSLTFKAPVVRDRAHVLTRAIFGLTKLEKLVVLDDIPIVDYTTNLQDIVPPSLRSLQSSSASPVELRILEPPNMAQNLTAGLLTYCEIHEVPCYAFFSLQESYLGKPLVSSETLDAYCDGLNKIGLGHLRYDKSRMRVEAQPNNRLYL
ncbi:hypothetical protein BX666DRAFT_2005881 [Dichotomocladium elegans]|nr:hypothetical protein BX666DRAFT_2005881 [Dichotomocladium elegans]